jgi:hypothetical protein
MTLTQAAILVNVLLSPDTSALSEPISNNFAISIAFDASRDASTSWGQRPKGFSWRTHAVRSEWPHSAVRKTGNT